LLALVLATTLLAAGAAFTQAPEGEDANPYIVVLKESVDDPSRVAEGIDQRQEGFELGFVYTNALEGFSAKIPDDSVDEVRDNPQVEYVERDNVVRATAQTLPWGVDRIGADESSTKAGNGRGKVSNVNVYIIDSGIDKSHPDLNVVGRKSFHGSKKGDCYGHGTHVAGTLAARDNSKSVVGVAPGAPLTSVKVLGCQGSGREAQVIKGVDWVTNHAIKPAVANLSLSGRASDDDFALDQAVIDSANDGIFYSVAAGNQGKDACKRTPARAGTNNGIVTTAAIRSSGEEASYSNFGSCVDLWAPGSRILSTKLGGGTSTMSGTSMASPHVGGTGALYLSNNTGASPADVESALKAQADRTGSTSKDHVTPVLLVDASGF